jgi:hypothetical protein
MNLTAHFTAAELQDRRHRRWLQPDSEERYARLARHTLEPLREAVGGPLVVISGERMESKTAASSRHMPPALRLDPAQRAPDAAADLSSGRMSPLQLALIALRLMAQREIPAGGVGLYRTFVHIDDRRTLRFWRGAGVDDNQWNTFVTAAADCRTAIRINMEVG